MMVFTIPEVLPIPIPGLSTAVSILRLCKHDSTLFGKSGGKSSTVLALGLQPSCQAVHRLLRPANGSDYRFANHTGEVIPVDGEVDKGDALVDQHALTGESAPAEKSRGVVVLFDKTGTLTQDRPEIGQTIGCHLPNSISFRRRRTDGLKKHPQTRQQSADAY
jgi:hypothetical protein